MKQEIKGFFDKSFKKLIGATVLTVLAFGAVLAFADAADAGRRSAFSIFVGKDRRLKMVNTQNNINPDTYLADGTLNVTLIAPVNYKLRRMDVNQTYFQDRAYVITGLPGYMNNNNRVWIIGYDADLLNASAEFLQFDIDDTARVYVLYDANAGSLPSWMSGKFTATGDQVFTDNPVAGTLNVYMAVLPKGSVRLGGNDGGVTGAQCNYTVMVRRPTAGQTATATQVASTKLSAPRQGHRVVTLNDGRVLIVGGVDTGNTLLTTAEIYDSTSQTFITTGALAQGRINPAVIKLDDGRVMAIGGDIGGTPSYNDGKTVAYGIFALASCEIFNPATSTWSATPDMGWRRRLPEAIKLSDGRIFVAGGVEDTSSRAIITTEIYNPVTSTWTPGPDLMTPRYGHRMGLLADGRVLIVGGMGVLNGPDLIDNAVTSTEIYDPVSNTIVAGASMTAPRSRFGLVDIGGNRFLAIGGLTYQKPSPPFTNAYYISTADVEIYDATANAWSPAAPLPRPMYDFAYAGPAVDRALLFDGFDVMGTEAGDILLYDAVLNNWTLVGSLVTSRSFPASNGGQMVADVGNNDYFLCGGTHFDEATGQTTVLNTGERFKY